MLLDSTRSSVQVNEIGHFSARNDADSRRSDIERTAEEILKAAERKRAEAFNVNSPSGIKRVVHLRQWTTDQRLPPIVQNLNAAALSPDITGDEFKKLYIVSRYGGGKANGIEIDNKTLAIAMHTDPRGWRRAKESLEAKGWLTASPTYRKGKQSVNSYAIKNPMFKLIENIDFSALDAREGQFNPPKATVGGLVEPSQNGSREGQSNPPNTKVGRVESCRLGGSNEPSFPGDPGIVVEVEGSALRAREDGCSEEKLQPGKETPATEEAAFCQGGLQEDVAKGHLFEPAEQQIELTPKQRLQHIFTRWGYAPTAEPKKVASYATVQRALNLAKEHGNGKPEHLAAKALQSVLAHMEEALEHEPDPKSKPGKGLAYFEARFKGTLRDLVMQDHNDRVEAKKVEAIAEEEVGTVKDQRAIRVKGTETRTDGYNQAAAAKRIEAGGKANGNVETIPAARFRDDERKVEVVADLWIEGHHANLILDGIEGSDVPFVRKLLLDAGRRKWKEKPTPAKVIDCCINIGERRKLEEVHGTPDKLAAGPPATCAYGEFKRALHVSQAFVDRMQSAYPSIEPDRMLRIFSSFDFDFEAMSYGAEQQAVFEAAFEDELREAHEHNLAAEKQRAENEAVGVSIVDGRVNICGWLAQEVDSKGGYAAFRAIEFANKDLRFEGLSVERIITVVRKIVDLARAGKPTAVCMHGGFMA
jgi:hypothetical protein